MKLRELYDKLAPGLLDCDVQVQIRTVLDAHHGPGLVVSTFRRIEAVRVQEDGTVLLVVYE